MIQVVLLFVIDVFMKLNGGWFYNPNQMLEPVITTIVGLSLILVWLGVKKRIIHPVAALSMTLGVASNLIDLIRVGYVIDYYQVGTAVYNIADLLILSGAIMAAFTLIKSAWRSRA